MTKFSDLKYIKEINMLLAGKYYFDDAKVAFLRSDKVNIYIEYKNIR